MNRRSNERRQGSRPRIDEDSTPILAMLWQIRTALADLFLPIFAGLKTFWLLLFRPKKFFTTFYRQPDDLAKMVSPFDVGWRAFSAEARAPLPPVIFLLFGIAFSLLVNISNRSLNNIQLIFGDVDWIEFISTSLARSGSDATNTVASINSFFANPILLQVQAFFEEDFVATFVELIVNLLATMVFTYLFCLFIRRKIATTNSYAFWVYMLGLQYCTTAISVIVIVLFGGAVATFFDSASGSILRSATLLQDIPFIAPYLADVTLTLPQLVRTAGFWFLESGWFIAWQFLLPAYLLPRLFEVKTMQVIKAIVLSNLVLAALKWGMTFAAGVFVLAVAS